MSSKIARYLVTRSAYIRGKTVCDAATTANPEVLELPPDVSPSRSWLPINSLAAEQLRKLGIDVPLVPAPTPRFAPRQAASMHEMAQKRTKLASEFFNGPRLADTSPVGDPVVPPTSKLTTPDKA